MISAIVKPTDTTSSWDKYNNWFFVTVCLLFEKRLSRSAARRDAPDGGRLTRRYWH
jgi:hypothetical protein